MNNDPNLYYKKVHRMGMLMTVAAMIVFFGVPFIACTIFDIMPTMKEGSLHGSGRYLPDFYTDELCGNYRGNSGNGFVQLYRLDYRKHYQY